MDREIEVKEVGIAVENLNAVVNQAVNTGQAVRAALADVLTPDAPQPQDPGAGSISEATPPACNLVLSIQEIQHTLQETVEINQDILVRLGV